MGKKAISLLIFACLLSFRIGYADPGLKPRTPEQYARQLEALQLLKGTDKGLELDRQLTRLEGIIMTLRLMGVEKQAKSYSPKQLYFKDVPVWAIGYAEYAYAKGLTKGIGEGLFGSYQQLSANDYATFMLRLLNYSDQAGDFKQQQALSKLSSLALIDNTRLQSIADNSFYRHEMAEITHGIIQAKPQFGNHQLINKLIALDLVDYQTAKQAKLVNSDLSNMPNNAAIINSYKGANYIALDYQNGTIGFKADTTGGQANWLLLNIRNANDKIVFEKNIQLTDGHVSFSQSFDLAVGSYAVDVFVNNHQYGSYQAWGYDGQIVINDGSMQLAVPNEVWQHNYTKHYFKHVSLKDLLASSESIQRDNHEIKVLAATIAKGKTSDYDKAKAVYDWVSTNIHYDMDAFKADKIIDQSARSVLSSKKAVCEGYANLTAALLRSIDLPTTVVHGYALGVDTSGRWVTPFKTPESNHAWNEVYIDGKWLVIDSTWGSNNQYNNGKFDANPANENYFDIALSTLSMTHYIMEYKK